MKSKLFALALLTTLSTHTLAQTEPVVMSYDGFFDRMEVVNEGDYQYAQVGFYLKTLADAKPCRIAKGHIETENQTYPLSYTGEGKLLLPFDEELDSFKAVVVATPEQGQGQCVLSIQIEADPQGGLLTQGEAFAIESEFKELLADLSGFWVGTLMPFLLPEHNGIQVHLAEVESSSAHNPQWQCEATRCKLVVQSSWEGSERVLSEQEVLKVTPWIKK